MFVNTYVQESEFGTPKTKKMVAKAVLKFRSLAREAQLRNSVIKYVLSLFVFASKLSCVSKFNVFVGKRKSP